MSIAGPRQSGEQADLADLVSAEKVEIRPAIEFDIEEELDDTRWAEMVGELRRLMERYFFSKSTNALKVTLMAESMRIARPEEFDKLEFLDDLRNIFEDAFKYNTENRTNGILDRALTIAERAWYVFPEMRFDIPNESISNKRRDCQEYLNEGWYDIVARDAVAVKILSYNEGEYDLSFINRYWAQFKKSFEKKCQNHSDWGEVAEYAINLRLLFPHKYSELNVAKYWSQIKGEYLDYAEINNIGIPTTYDIAQLRTLAAEEVKMTGNGLELIMPDAEDYQQSTPPRPERIKTRP